MERTLILGGGYAGSLAAVRLAKRGVAVTLVDAGEGLVDRIRLHQVIAGDDIAVTPYKTLFRNLAIEVVRARVIRIDRERHSVTTTGGELQYDTLIYALGSASPAFNGMTSAREIRERLRNASTVAIIGAGLTGIETSAEIAERFANVKVHLYDARRIGSDLSAGAERHLRDWMIDHGVTLHDNSRIDSIDADVVLRCTPFNVSPIAREAGFEVNARGQIIVDDNLRSSDRSIFAAGDAAVFRNVRMGCVSAMPMAAYAADFIAGATRDPFRFAFQIRCISLGRRDGIVQFVNADDSVREGFLKGRPAAWVKEFICRYVMMSIRMERLGVHYSWPKTATA